ncbi:MAG: REP-associated tyrosine transposase [Candidatus Kerfeldbacteria bacterium]
MHFKKFHPPHLYLDNCTYFLSSRTLDKKRYFNTDHKKGILADILKSASKRYKIILYGWVILENHYHLLIKVDNKKQLINFIKTLHGKSAIELNKFENKPKRKIWVNYWDKCVESEKDFHTHLNYIHHNPIKHKYVKDMSDYKYSSYQYYLSKYGYEWLENCFYIYPIIDFTSQDI